MRSVTTVSDEFGRLPMRGPLSQKMEAKQQQLPRQASGVKGQSAVRCRPSSCEALPRNLRTLKGLNKTFAQGHVPAKAQPFAPKPQCHKTRMPSPRTQQPNSRKAENKRLNSQKPTLSLRATAKTLKPPKGLPRAENGDLVSATSALPGPTYANLELYRTPLSLKLSSSREWHMSLKGSYGCFIVLGCLRCSNHAQTPKPLHQKHQTQAQHPTTQIASGDASFHPEPVNP